MNTVPMHIVYSQIMKEIQPLKTAVLRHRPNYHFPHPEIILLANYFMMISTGYPQASTPLLLVFGRYYRKFPVTIFGCYIFFTMLKTMCKIKYVARKQLK